MALEPLWFSTMWGVYQFSGLIMGTLATMIIACVTLRKFGPLAGVFRDEHLHDLGKLLLGFSCFWMYIWFSQYMLIWYSNIPEETSYFIPRTQGASHGRQHRAELGDHSLVICCCLAESARTGMLMTSPEYFGLSDDCRDRPP